uniref:Uncharacterized protein n=1 Tax=Vannella robusta TaxID=1487602 RepID=A0A7S4IDV7_9EUKA|mmetsp:Transcript_24396/g.31026  ORF Transcript_24396/g.31026 Transcript_24396/m.31026 type:complete len:188 (+) Transcript_24396:1-564(+)
MKILLADPRIDPTIIDRKPAVIYYGDNSDSVLHTVCNQGCLPGLQLLLKDGRISIYTKNHFQEMPFHHAMKRPLEVMETLLNDKQTDFNRPEIKNGKLALAAWVNHRFDILQLLLQEEDFPFDIHDAREIINRNVFEPFTQDELVQFGLICAQFHKIDPKAIFGPTSDIVDAIQTKVKQIRTKSARN